MKKRCTLFSLSILTLSIFFPATAVSDAKEIKIGIVGPMQYHQGQEIWNGAEMAADEINSKGGVRFGGERLKLRLLKADTKELFSSQYAANMVEMLLIINRVDFIIGGFRSEAVYAMQDVAMDYHKIFISIGAASEELSERVALNYDRYKYYFRGGVFNNYYLIKSAILQLNSVAGQLRQKLGVEEIKVAIVADKATWVDKMINVALEIFPEMGLTSAGVFRVSSEAMDASSQIRAIAKSNAPLVFTLFSSYAGVSFVIQSSNIGLPAVMTGINLEAQRKDFWEKTGGKADYVITTSAYCQGVEINKLTGQFIQRYLQRYGDLPTVASESYCAIANLLVPAIEQSGVLDPDRLVTVMENNEYPTPRGIWAFGKDQDGRPLHELKFGSEYAFLVGVQWRNGKMRGIWPNEFVETAGAPPLTYKGVEDIAIPPWVIDAYE